MSLHNPLKCLRSLFFKALSFLLSCGVDSRLLLAKISSNDKLSGNIMQAVSGSIGGLIHSVDLEILKECMSSAFNNDNDLHEGGRLADFFLFLSKFKQFFDSWLSLRSGDVTSSSVLLPITSSSVSNYRSNIIINNLSVKNRTIIPIRVNLRTRKFLSIKIYLLMYH